MMTEQGTSNSDSPRVVHQPHEMQQLVQQMRQAGKRVGMIPTMGALHEGHLSLVRRSVEQCDATVVTIFVNPTQFGPQEDFARYPRTFASDLQKLAEESADLVFAPANELMYPEDFSTFVDPPSVGDRLEGNCRPGHFRGVTTIVMKLFQIVPADVAFFGQKDYQQCLVIQHMVRDLNVPIHIEICPTVRESDGLAMSSRNQYLSADQRQQGLALSRSLDHAVAMFKQAETDSNVIRSQMRQILSDAGITQVDYVALVDPYTLRDVEMVVAGTMALIAAHVGKTRLIDNRRIG
jgi:pantoate--beta-alanine ligase